MKITIEKFFELYRKYFGKLTQGQVEGIEFLLTKAAASRIIASKTAQITLAKIAYILATVQLETAYTFQPITEMGSKRYLQSRRYWPYIGRGYVQLTWDWNYKQFGKALGIDLFNKPELANDPETAWLILEEGMTDLTPQDPEFTGKSLEDYFNENGLDFYNARMIINPKDKSSYKPIQTAAINFYKILCECIAIQADAVNGDTVAVEIEPMPADEV